MTTPLDNVEVKISKNIAMSTALEMLSEAFKKTATRATITSVRQYIYSIETMFPKDIILGLYDLLSRIEMYQLKYNDKY